MTQEEAKKEFLSKYNAHSHIPFKDGRWAHVDEIHIDFIICYVHTERMLFRYDNFMALVGEPDRWE